MAKRSLIDTETIGALAQEFRSALGIDPQATPDMRDVLRKLPKIYPEFRVEVVPNSRTSAFAWVASQKLFIKKSVIEALSAGDAHARYTIAHEMAHLVLGHKGHSYRKAPKHGRNEQQIEEKEAMIFASEFLMPVALAYGQTPEEIQKKFQVSSAAAVKRFAELKSIDSVPLAPTARAQPDVVKELARHGYSEKELSALVVPKRTLARRRSDKELLSIEETDKALRLKRIASLAEKVFDDPAKAHRWMRKAKRSLAGEAPLAYLASEAGARIVEDMLHRIEHGIFA
jgi:putative toxin-antitoxin system antitoxin component (TIGR02293 family)